MIQNCPTQLQSEPVRECARKVFEQLQSTASGTLEADGKVPSLSVLISLFALSPYLMSICNRYPSHLVWLLKNNLLEPDANVADVATLRNQIEWDTQLGVVDPQTGCVLEAEQIKRIRLFRHREMLRILWRDFNSLSDVDDTLRSLSNMADACIQSASMWAHNTIAQRFGIARDSAGNAQQLLVLGMGKLGGQELNVSSDIDLIYLFAESGQSDGKRSIENVDYFRHVGQLLTRLLGTVTEDGFAFRVDTRLRPFGDSGPLVMSLNGVEQYYLTQGRDWERYAMIKARPIVFDDRTYASFNELLTPFVYRRYLDYNAIQSLRELKRKIALSVKQKGMVDNIKLGAGGIREIEFIGQAFQLVRGGRQEKLRARPLKHILRTLQSLGLMSKQDVTQLCDAYDFLRKTENALQAMRDQQVHALPTDSDDKLRLLTLLGMSDWAQFTLALQGHRDIVASRFEAVFSDWSSAESVNSDASDDVEVADAVPVTKAMVAWAVISAPETDAMAASEALAEIGIEAEQGLLESLLTLCRGGFYQRLTARAQRRVDQILPLLMDASLEHENTAQCLSRCLVFVDKVAGRSGYLQILIERPPALARLVTLFARSEWVASFVARHPIVVDELLRDTSSETLPTREALLEDAKQEASRLMPLELDEQMDGMRHFQQSRELRVAVAELIEDLPLMRVSDQLTWLAESVVHAVFMLVEKPLQARHGKPSCYIDEKLNHPDVGIVAYGKLGGIELGYGSDLDLVFLHNSGGTRQETDGDKPVDNGFYYARLAQKLVNFMSTQTPAGVLYEIDLRLRPNGQSGVLVTGLDSFAQYQQDNAWTWEHQALVRARTIMAPEDIRVRFDEIRQNILCATRDSSKLLDDVVQMRQRMRDNLNSAPEGQMHLKNDPGGIGDIEFIVQFLVLCHASERTELVQYRDNIRILEQVVSAKIMSRQDSDTLRNHYQTLRSLLHRQSLQSLEPVIPVNDKIDTIQAQVSELWKRLLLATGP